jgi:hypothetical protein
MPPKRMYLKLQMLFNQILQLNQQIKNQIQLQIQKKPRNSKILIHQPKAINKTASHNLQLTQLLSQRPKLRQQQKTLKQNLNKMGQQILNQILQQTLKQTHLKKTPSKRPLQNQQLSLMTIQERQPPRDT